MKITFAKHFPDAEDFFADEVSRFRPEHGGHAEIEVVGWEKLWDHLQRISAGRAAAAVSEVGTTWTGHFIESGSISPLSEAHLALIGGADRFFDSAWQSTSLIGDHRVFAVPWLADTRVVYYWRSDLAAAGVDEPSAFVSPACFSDTLDRLKCAGMPAWGAPTFQVNNTLHQIASWIWGYGGDFLSDDGKRTTFLDASALKGICDYFRLYRFMPRNFDTLTDVLDTFEEHRLSVTVNGPWYLMRMMLGGANQEMLDDLGVALPPGPPFVGGSNLVFWKLNEAELDAAMSLVSFLLSPPVRRRICTQTGLLPVTDGLLKEAPYAGSPHYQMFQQALELGRPLPMIAFWGPLEEALLKGFGAIWEELKNCRGGERLETVVERHLEPISRRFDRILRLI